MLMSSQSSFARRAIMFAAAAAVPSFAFAVGNAGVDDNGAAPTYQVYQPTRADGFGSSGPLSLQSGPGINAGTQYTWDETSPRARQYIVLGGNPNAPAGAGTTSAYPTWSTTSNWNPAAVPD